MPHREDVRNKWMEEKKKREEEKERDSGESRELGESDKKCPTTIGKCPIEAVQEIL